MLGVCSAEGEWGGRGIEDREVYDGNKVKEVSGSGGHPCSKQCCWYQKVGLHGKVRLAGMGLHIVKVSVAIISGICWGQNVKMLVWLGDNALGCP